MGLSAFTNDPGTHVKYGTFPVRTRGRYFGNHDVDEGYNQQIVTEIASKFYPTPGYGGCTEWGRKVQKLIANEPARARRLIYSGTQEDGIEVDLMMDEYISSGFPLGTSDLPDPGSQNAKDESVNTALNQLTQHYAGIGADLAEARQTCDMFAKNALKAGQFLHQMKKFQFKQAGETLLGKKFGGLKPLQNGIADLWLEYSYGWAPLAADLKKSQELAHAALMKPVPITAYGHGVSHRTETIGDYYKFRLDKSTTTSHKTLLRAHVSNPLTYLLSSAGLINPLSIAWELVPFSFVVDWFVPVGNTLQAITAGVGLESDGGYTSTQVETEVNIERLLPPVPDNSSYYLWVESGKHREIGFYFARQCYAGFPNPRLYSDVTPYSTARALNALALVRQLV